MISKHLTILSAVAALLLTTACSSDDMDATVASGRVSAQVTASINDGTTLTRATNSGDASSFASGDIIKVVETGIGEVYSYTMQDDGTWLSTAPYYFKSTADVSFMGIYAHPSVTLSDDNTISIDTSTGQATTADGWNKWDILATPAVTASVASPTINFTDGNAFAHKLSKMTFTFVIGDDYTSLSSVTGYAVKYITTDATYYPLYYYMAPGSTTGSISADISTSETSVTCAPIIVVPQTLPSGKFTLEVTFENDQKGYSVDLSLPSNATNASAFTAGEHYTYTVSINKTGLQVVSAAIKDWNTATVSGDAKHKGYTYDSATNTYTVYNEAALKVWAKAVANDSTTNCTLGANINMSAVEEGESNWSPIGYYTSTKVFAAYPGTFDGNGYTITGLTINSSTGGTGLIGYLGEGGVVKNLTLEDVNISSAGSYTGAVVGRNAGTISECTVSGTISCTGNYVGGIAGYDVAGGTIVGCYSSANVSSTYSTNYTYIGGVVGSISATNSASNYARVIACYSTGTVSGVKRVGGVAGYLNGSKATIAGCFSTGDVSGTQYVGGMVGYVNTNGTLKDGYATGGVTGDTNYGIIVGSSNSTYIQHCYYVYNGTLTDYNSIVGDGFDGTWASAATAMNSYMDDYTYTADDGTTYYWQYVVNEDYDESDSTSAPLLLVKQTETTEETTE